jgi:hypothetical protein
MSTWLIYKHENVLNGKVYIGLTKYTMEARWSKHCYSARCKPEGHFHHAIAKYGREVWESEVLVDGLPTEEEALAKEMYYVEVYDSMREGYNSTEGGDYNPMMGAAKADSVRKQRISRKVPTHKLYNVITSKSFEGYVGDLAKSLELGASAFSGVVAGKQRSAHGWVLDTPANRNYKILNRYWFVHDTYGTDYATIDEMVRKYPSITSRGNLSGVVYGTRKSHQGWQIIHKDKK